MTFTIKIEELLGYFDLKSSTNYGDTTAIISVVGEDLCTAIFQQYCEQQRQSSIEIIDSNLHIPTTMKKIGRRLDRWIIETKDQAKILYQAEIKNWCARAIGGLDVPIIISTEELEELANTNWLRHKEMLENKESNGVNKVLVDMVSSQRLELDKETKKEPLIIFWEATKPKGEKDFFFRHNLTEVYFDFDYTLVFSCSLYLHHLLALGQTDISLTMPNALRRIGQLNNLFK